jgi:hypothetical protein
VTFTYDSAFVKIKHEMLQLVGAYFTRFHRRSFGIITFTTRLSGKPTSAADHEIDIPPTRHHCHGLGLLAGLYYK